MSKELHHDEVLSNVFLFMVAGYETTATTLAYCTYVLATKRDIQDNLVVEIDKQELGTDGYGDYDLVANMPYMDLFVREVLRMFPVVPQASNRQCNATTSVCGYTIEEGLVSSYGSVLFLYIVSSFRQCHSA
jgi:cytochrome P450 family 13